MAGQIAATRVPAGERLALRVEPSEPAIRRQHSIRLEREEIFRVELLRVFQGAAGEPHRGQGQRAGGVRDRVSDSLREAGRHEPGGAADDDFEELTAGELHEPVSPKRRQRFRGGGGRR